MTVPFPTRAIDNKEDDVTLRLLGESDTASPGTGDGGNFWALTTGNALAASYWFSKQCR